MGLIAKQFGASAAPVVEDAESARLGRNEVIKIPSHCPNCGTLGESLTAITDIPHFKEVDMIQNFEFLLRFL